MRIGSIKLNMFLAKKNRTCASVATTLAEVKNFFTVDTATQKLCPLSPGSAKGTLVNGDQLRMCVINECLDLRYMPKVAAGWVFKNPRHMVPLEVTQKL